MSAIGQRTLSPLALEWLAMLPRVLQDDPWIHGILNAQAREAERLIAVAEHVAEGLIPTTANELTLPLWEALLGLPVSPPGTDVDTRRGLVLSRLLRGDGSGLQWEGQMEQATNNTYSYSEYRPGSTTENPRPYTLDILTALPPGVTIGALRQYVRQISPANLHLNVDGGQTYQEVKTLHATYTAARNAYLDYDNMRYGVAS